MTEQKQFEQQPNINNPVKSAEKTAAEKIQEQNIEVSTEESRPGSTEKSGTDQTGGIAVQTAQKIPAAPVKTEIRKNIEFILSENLSDIYRSLDAEHKTAFKIKGEQTAQDIETLFLTAKTTLRKIIRLIRDWLKIIPSVNKYFLEQEAKIKADKLMGIGKKNK